MSRVAAIAAIFTGLTILASPAHACDSNYPWTCKPVASIDPPEAAADTAAKPLQITSRRTRAAARAQARAAKAAAKVERSAQTSRKRMARRSATKRWAVRARHAKLVAARVTAEQAEVERPSEEPKVAAPKARETASKPTPRPERIADGNGPSTSFAAIWAERSIAAPEPAVLAATSQTPDIVVDASPATPMPVASGVAVASQDDVNELDLAAAPRSARADSFWLRGLFLAFGGLLAVGSALRLFV